MKKSFKKWSITLIVAASSICTGSGETIYFLVAAPGAYFGPDSYVCEMSSDSYVLPLSAQEDIDHARFLISLGCPEVLVSPPSFGQLVVARVGPGRDGINRNYMDPKLPEWSWHVVEFRQFADRTVDTLDGSPTYLDHHPEWYSGTDPRQGLIGFWAYTVVRELGPSPLYLSVIPDGANLQLYWTAPGTNSYVYTLEAKESLPSTNWMAVAGASWPLATNHWTLPLTNAPAGFFRVRAEPSG